MITHRVAESLQGLQQALAAPPSTPASQLAALALAIALLLLMLQIGTLIGRGLGVHQWGIPEALIAGSLALAIAPAGWLPLIPPPVIALWDGLPLILLTLVFGTLLVGKPLPRLGGLWRPLSAQVLLALTLAFGQYLVAGLAVLLLLQPRFGMAPATACLIEVAFEGGHGSAAAMGPTYERLGVEGGSALGLAMATVGLLASTLLGGLVVVLARRLGWLGVAASPAPSSDGAGASAAAGSIAPQLPTAALWALNLAFAGVAVAIGCGLLAGLQTAAHRLGGGVAVVIDALPVFPLALIGSLLVRLVLERSGRAGLASLPVQSRIGTFSADLLIVAATACLDLSLLVRDWLPLLVLALVGLIWNLAVVLLFGRRLLPAPWFERGILEFGQATGVAASGLLLLAMADPHDRGDALTPFSIKQLLLQPLLAGGVITVVAPLAVQGLGLPLWTLLCGLLVLVWIACGLWLGRSNTAPG
ncbi:MAG: sodium:solute symporter [Synechococcaceae cyanobacterium]|nr:sodium:solute symporter [Synechococcaceae cyanobacterium]